MSAELVKRYVVATATDANSPVTIDWRAIAAHLTATATEPSRFTPRTRRVRLFWGRSA